MSADHDCSCGECTTDDLPVNPFEALRARQGMLLGEDDFRALMGNPRGKQMLHAAWLHGTGVVWGLAVERDGTLALSVRPGLAIDGMGRELALTATEPIDLRDWLKHNDHPANQDGCENRTVTACLVLEFLCTTGRPVPTLADPCDVTRTHDTDSRILEQAAVRLVHHECPPCHRYRRDRRLRMLFGLDELDLDDVAGRHVAGAQAEVAACPPRERTGTLCHHLRCLAAADAAEHQPACQEGTNVRTLFPLAEEDAAVVLACVEIDVRDADGCTTIREVRLDDCCRCVLLPTQTITELLCALAARVYAPTRARPQNGGHRNGDRRRERSEERDDRDDVEGPRIFADRVTWDEDELCYLIPVTAELAEGSVRRAVTVTSLSARGWIEEDIERAYYDAESQQIVVRMTAWPQNDVVRLMVNGTGPTPAFGVDPVAPLAGVHGGPRAGRHDGRDAVITVTGVMREREGS